MRPTIDTRVTARQLPGRALATLAAIALVVLLFAIIGAAIKDYGSADDPGFSWIMVSRGTIQYPHVLAGDLTITNGLKEFSGKPPEGMSPRMASLVLLGVLLTYVLGPALMFFAFRRRALGDKGAILRPAAIVGFTLSGFWMVSIVPAVVTQFQVRQSLRSAQSVQQVRDEIINDLNEIAMWAHTYYVLPVTRGGGGRNFRGISVPTRFMETNWGTYTISANQRSLKVLGRPTFNPYAVYTSAARTPIPEASVSVVVDSTGQMRDWEYTGLFQ